MLEIGFVLFAFALAGLCFLLGAMVGLLVRPRLVRTMLEDSIEKASLTEEQKADLYRAIATWKPGKAR